MAGAARRTVESLGQAVIGVEAPQGRGRSRHGLGIPAGLQRRMGTVHGFQIVE